MLQSGALEMLGHVFCFELIHLLSIWPLLLSPCQIEFLSLMLSMCYCCAHRLVHVLALIFLLVVQHESACRGKASLHGASTIARAAITAAAAAENAPNAAD